VHIVYKHTHYNTSMYNIYIQFYSRFR